MTEDIQMQILEELRKLNRNMDRFMAMRHSNQPAGANGDKVGAQGFDVGEDIAAKVKAQIAAARQQAERVAGGAVGMPGNMDMLAMHGRSNTG